MHVSGADVVGLEYGGGGLSSDCLMEGGGDIGALGVHPLRDSVYV